MNDKIADKTIEDHKYLLELVENRAAIAYFACANRNQSLFNALRSYIRNEIKNKEEEEDEQDSADKKNGKKKIKEKKKAKNAHEAE